jgi:hypothetical protein
MAQYLLAVHGVDGEQPPAPEVMQQMFADVSAFNDRVQVAGGWVFAGGLEPPASAEVFRSAGGRTEASDGPFATAPVFLSGMWIVDAPDLATARAWAAEGAAACQRPVELRPFQVEPPEG